MRSGVHLRLPLTLTLSPEGRGECVAQDANLCPLFPRHISGCARFPLPSGERARVRGCRSIPAGVPA